MNTTNKNQRINFASIKNKVGCPDFLDVQLKSFQSFFQIGTTLEERRNEGLYKAFEELFPIADARNNFVSGDESSSQGVNFPTKMSCSLM